MTLIRGLLHDLFDCFHNHDDTDDADSDNDDNDDNDSDDERFQQNFEIEYASWRAQRHATAHRDIPETLATLSNTTLNHSTARATPHYHMSSPSPPPESHSVYSAHSTILNTSRDSSGSAVAARSLRRKPVAGDSRSLPRPDIPLARLPRPYPPLSKAHCKGEPFSLPPAIRRTSQYPPFSRAHCKDSTNRVSIASAVRNTRPTDCPKESMGNCFMKQDRSSNSTMSGNASLNMSTISLDEAPRVGASARQPQVHTPTLGRSASQTTQTSHLSAVNAIRTSSAAVDDETATASDNVRFSGISTSATSGRSIQDHDPSAANDISILDLLRNAITASALRSHNDQSSTLAEAHEQRNSEAVSLTTAGLAGSNDSAPTRTRLSANLTSLEDITSGSYHPTTSPSTTSLNTPTSSTAATLHPNATPSNSSSHNTPSASTASVSTDEMTSTETSTGSTHLAPTKIKRKRNTECLICGNETSVHTRFPSRKITSTCKHDGATCKLCLKTWISSQLDVVAWDQIPCPEECAEIMRHGDVRFHASAAVFRRYDNASLRSYLSTDPTFLPCPAPHCTSGQLHPLGPAEPIFRCVACTTRSCIVCTTPWHEGRTCTEYQQDLADAKDATAATAKRNREERARKQAEEKASEVLIGKEAKVCPGRTCGARIEKTGGCDHMTCRRCRTEFCWLCQADYKDIMATGNMAHRVGCRYRM